MGTAPSGTPHIHAPTPRGESGNGTRVWAHATAGKFSNTSLLKVWSSDHRDPGKGQPCTSSGLLHGPQIPSQVLEAVLNPQKEREGAQRGRTVATLLPGLGTGGGGAHAHQEALNKGDLVSHCQRQAGPHPSADPGQGQRGHRAAFPSSATCHSRPASPPTSSSTPEDAPFQTPFCPSESHALLLAPDPGPPAQPRR